MYNNHNNYIIVVIGFIIKYIYKNATYSQIATLIFFLVNLTSWHSELLIMWYELIEITIGSSAKMNKFYRK